jgi:hypothetical protein
MAVCDARGLARAACAAERFCHLLALLVMAEKTPDAKNQIEQRPIQLMMDDRR